MFNAWRSKDRQTISIVFIMFSVYGQYVSEGIKKGTSCGVFEPTTAELCKMVDATILDTYGVQKETSSNLVQLIKGNLKQSRLVKDEPFTWTPLQSLISGVEPTLVFALNQIHPAEITKYVQQKYRTTAKNGHILSCV